ncbi:EAL domain-containing protein [Marinomonas posidonica]|uniref:Diguanylate cyclase/phosphodiesterase n=1 Tax=Marinomonas posidonica (strain CECT 7376 / NCIMB 14433 / IVIA-Po-181) TaxID=491952 RepID=F6CRU1_MARPP|nr:EAL domain-containing protein [Marinomonas posidonica]AEF54944.1 diguanylate cyclase/phosphodiesterase [Marinomonas posidonica IVIA-Po-181]
MNGGIRLICLFTALLVSQVSWSYDIQIEANAFPTFAEKTPLTPKEALYQEYNTDLYEGSQDFSDHAYWHKITFPKTYPFSQQTFYLELDYYVIEELDFYVFHDTQLVEHLRRGALQDWNKLGAVYDGILIPIILSPFNETHLLIRKAGDSPLLTPVRLLNNSEAEFSRLQKLIFWTAIISCLVILLAHNALVFILLRQAGFIYYLGLNALVFIALSIITGFSRWLFNEAFSQWLVANIFLIFGVGAWLLFRFSLHFLREVKVPSPKSFLARHGDWIFIIFLLCNALLPVKTVAGLFAGIEVFLFISCTYWGVKAFIRGFIAVRFYLFSWLFLIAGSIINTLLFWKLIPINDFTEAIFPAFSIIQLLGFSFALADKAKQSERNRQLQLLTDQSTGLPNRLFYFDELPNQIQLQIKNQQPMALVIIDIINHHSLSQAFGPAKADAVMCELMQELHQHIQPIEGLLAFHLPNKTHKRLIRMTARNLAFISTTPNMLETQIQRVQQMLEHPTQLNKIQFRHQYKIGSALFPSQGSNLDRLYQNALIAHNSVTFSSGTWAAFTDELKSDHAQQLTIITLLREDIRNGRLHYHIQPQVCLRTNKIIGGEVLLRWHNEQLGPVSPAEFVPLAEQAGLIYPLTEMLFEKVFVWASQHQDLLKTTSLSLNISALDLLQADFAQKVYNSINVHQLTPEQFTLEITETSMFHNNDIVNNNVEELHKTGFKLSIDDFGIGYSSMLNLVTLKTNELKIDQFFVMGLLKQKSNQYLCQNMIHLCQQLNITSVAEGIEDQQTLATLKDWQCEIGQGYFLYKPMSPDDYLLLLQETLCE